MNLEIILHKLCIYELPNAMNWCIKHILLKYHLIVYPSKKNKNRKFFSYGKKIRGKRKLLSYRNVVKCVDDKYDKYMWQVFIYSNILMRRWWPFKRSEFEICVERTYVLSKPSPASFICAIAVAVSIFFFFFVLDAIILNKNLF